MRKIERLRREALKQATARGHVMGRFKAIETDHHTCVVIRYTTHCILCGMWIAVDSRLSTVRGDALEDRCRPTIAHIAERNAAAGGYYFSRDTLRFFGQRRSDFKVHVVKGRVFVQASSYQGGNYTGESFAEFNPKTGCMSGVNSTMMKQSVADFLARLKGC